MIEAALRAIAGERVSLNAGVREQHGRGEGLRTSAPPDYVVWPESNAEVAALLKLCSETLTPVIPFGVGTSLEGQVAAPHGGVCIDVSRMNAVLAVNAADLDCRVQAGVTRTALNAAVRGDGLFFPLDPGADATLGGMAATRASGTNAVRYGTMREVTLGLTVVTPAGDIVETGGRARKSSAGYDLTRLYVGSEGTLGIITELQVRLFGLPECVVAASCQFPDLRSAVDAVVLTLQAGVPIARVELLDALQMRACIAYSRLDGFADAPTLFLEFHGGPESVAEQVRQTREIMHGHGATAFAYAERPEDRTRLWSARHNAWYAALALKPGYEAFATDACVPISGLGDAVEQAQTVALKAGLTCPIVGHVGDGNFHVMLLYDPAVAGARARADAVSAEIAGIAQALGGTCTGEHGVGLHKQEALAREHPGGLPLMRAIKSALDPRGIMNPAKMFIHPIETSR